jgi:hypothetical protein
MLKENDEKWKWFFRIFSEIERHMGLFDKPFPTLLLFLFPSLKKIK